MRIAVISDIHGNLTALEAVLADLDRVAPDQVVCGGDLVANGSRPAEVLDLIRDRGWPTVVGNTDEMLWRPDLLALLLARTPSRGQLREVLFRHIAPFAAQLLGDERIQWLKQLPPTWSNGRLTVLHAGPGDLWRAPLADASDADLSTYSRWSTPTVVYGHIHRPFVRKLNGLTVANSGSVSLSYDGDPRASYAVVDDGSVSIRRVDYNRAEELRRLGELSYPFAGWIADLLVTASYHPPPPSSTS